MSMKLYDTRSGFSSLNEYRWGIADGDGLEITGKGRNEQIFSHSRHDLARIHDLWLAGIFPLLHFIYDLKFELRR